MMSVRFSSFENVTVYLSVRPIELTGKHRVVTTVGILDEI